MLSRTATAAVALVTALAFAAGPALAAGGETGGGTGDDVPAFDKADANGDGEVSIEEAQEAGVPKAEARAEDVDDDGTLSRADWGFVDMNAGSSPS